MNPHAPRPESLALIFQEALTSIVRLQREPGKAPPMVDFANRVRLLLDKARADALRSYEPRVAEIAESAVTALLDETAYNPKMYGGSWPGVYASRFPGRPNVPGENFFQDLDQLITSGAAHQRRDVLEVYLTCLLLGFQGVFGVPNHPGIRRLRFQTLSGYHEDLKTAFNSSAAEVFRVGPAVDTTSAATHVSAGRTRPIALILIAVFVLVPILIWAFFRFMLADDLSRVQAFPWRAV